MDTDDSIGENCRSVPLLSKLDHLAIPIPSKE
jgi:hypothetical protein